MSILKINHKKVFNLFLLFIATTIIFRKPCTYLIISFIIYNIINYKKLIFLKTFLPYILIISSPLLIELFFFWNNENFNLGLKSLEKYLSLIVFSFFIIGNLNQINFYSLLKKYSTSTTLIILLFILSYCFEKEQFLMSYYYGMNMWQMGYNIADYIGIHAPALNMHLAFVSICNFYFYFYSKNKSQKISSFFIFLLSFMFVLIINTRTAFLVSVIGYITIIYFQLKNKKYFLNHLKPILISLFFVILSTFIFVKNNNYMFEKYNNLIFENFDKIGKLDTIERPEVEVYSALVTRLTIWKTALDLILIKDNFFYGVGSSDSKPELFKYYKQTNQFFLYKYKFPIHNQYIDFTLKFGILGLICILFYIGLIAYLGVKLNNPIILAFFFIIFLSNLTDDFLIRFDGIVFSGFWISLFSAFYLQKKLKIIIIEKSLVYLF